ncbi:hypothetical protein L6164_024890 [Bauhinia variegata]|uniref:Uncharacterized protein n=1 Tax=Bauhinia variegata TaxID=167791 RepID=A0ACB9M1X4_BAUVA|nr:hypothetical protein L6164_024890 [Bauhinia variegata]
MVTTTDSSPKHHSPTYAGISGTGDSNSPKFPRKNLPSPWAQVVRGGEPESASGIHQSPPSSSSSSSSLTIFVPDLTPSSDSSPKAGTASLPVDNFNTAAADTSDSNNGNAGRPKKPAWNKLSNGVVEVGPVMGAVSWPALSESTKASTKMLADSSSKSISDGSLSSTQGPVTLHSPQKQGTSNAKPNSSNYNRQRSVKRGGGSNIGSGTVQSSFSNPPPPPPPPPFPVFQVPPSSYGNVVPGVPDNSTRNWDTRPLVGSFVPAVNDHRSSSRRGNFGPHPRGDGPYHNNYGGRRDQDRGNTHHQRVPPRGLVRHPPPNAAAFVPPQPVGGPFVNPMGFPEFYYFPTLPLEPFRGMPFFTHSPPAIFYPVEEHPLTNMILNQIEYYFSDGNLVKDEFLRSNMDEQGWVPITLIANFPRVKNLTSNIQLILDSLRTSTVVEMQGDKLRRRNEWMKWLPSAQLRTDSGSVSPGGSSHNNLATNFQKITLEEATSDKSNMEPITDAFTGRFPTESQLPNSDATRGSN